jgi:hypothetical protein
MTAQAAKKRLALRGKNRAIGMAHLPLSGVSAAYVNYGDYMPRAIRRGARFRAFQNN